MKTGRIPTKSIIWASVALCFGIALFIRVYFPYEQVFRDGLIKFTGNDAYYFMRLADNLAQNFPHAISFDPYLTFPGGKLIDTPPFFTWLLGGIIWLIGLGAPTEHTVDLVGIYFPAVLAALIVVPVYFIGKELFGRWAGLISAALLAILPGEFMGRSIIGFTDYHVAEVLFTTTAMLFLVLAIRSSRQSGLTFDHLRREQATAAKPIIYSLLAGVFLGIYLITWLGALLFVFIITVYLVIQSVIDHLRHQSTDYLGVVGVIIFAVALIIYGPIWHTPLHTWSLAFALLVAVGLSLVSWWMTRKRIRPGYYPLTLVGLGVVGLAIFYLIQPALVKDMLSTFTVFIPRGVELTTMEMQPLLKPGDKWTLLLAWGNYTTGFFISLAVLLFWIVYARIIRKQGGSAEENILLIWSVIILLTALGQRRFAYYFAVNVALLTGYASWQFLRLVSFKKEKARPPDRAKKKDRLARKYQEEFRLTVRPINMVLAVIVIFFSVFFFNIQGAMAVARQARFAPSDAWVNSMIWLRQNTPEPFGDPNFYYQLYQPPPKGEAYQYPESAYGVMSWWDYGYFITRIAHRLPYSSPGSPPASRADTAHFFLSQDEDSAQRIVKELGSAYVVIDHQTTTIKFYAIAEWAGMNRTQFYDIYFRQQGDRLVAGVLYYPEYYRSLVVRLYNFDGQAVTPKTTGVISYEDKVHQEAGPIKVITDIREFPSYEAAEAYISGQKSGNHRIVSGNPFVSPVPLSALKHYKLIHSSDTVKLSGIGLTIPEVKIFEYVGD